MITSGTILGNLRYRRIYTYYNGPLFFVAANDKDHLYLGIWVDRQNDEDIWLYIRIGEERLQKMEDGEIPVHAIFSNPENGLYYKGIYGIGPNSDRVEVITSIPDDYLPPDQAWCITPDDDF